MKQKETETTVAKTATKRHVSFLKKNLIKYENIKMVQLF